MQTRVLDSVVNTVLCVSLADGSVLYLKSLFNNMFLNKLTVHKTDSTTKILPVFQMKRFLFSKRKSSSKLERLSITTGNLKGR